MIAMDCDRLSMDLVGGKFYRQKKMAERGLPIPRFFCLTAAFYERVSAPLRDQVKRQLAAINFSDLESIHRCSEAVQALFISIPLGKDLEQEIFKHFDALEGDGEVGGHADSRDSGNLLSPPYIVDGPSADGVGADFAALSKAHADGGVTDFAAPSKAHADEAGTDGASAGRAGTDGEGVSGSGANETGDDKALPSRFNKTVLVAVRSSIVGHSLAESEDSADNPFAGLSRSFLYVPREQILEKIRLCWASGFSREAILYRHRQGLAPDGFSVAVGIQEMVPGERSFVLFTCDPRTAARDAVIIAGFGIGEGVVQEKATVDHYFVKAKTGEILRSIAIKTGMLCFNRAGGSGLIGCSVPEERQRRACISDEEIHSLVELGRKIEAIFRCPQDIEGTITPDGKMHILQTRPVALDYRRQLVWSNANITESFPGTTTVLTYSVARLFYRTIFTDCYRRLGIRRQTLQDNFDVLDRMVGFLNGRIYYCLTSFYHLHSLSPLFPLFCRHWEKMMGFCSSYQTQAPKQEQAPKRALKKLCPSNAGDRNGGRWVVRIGGWAKFRQRELPTHYGAPPLPSPPLGVQGRTDLVSSFIVRSAWCVVRFASHLAPRTFLPPNIKVSAPEPLGERVRVRGLTGREFMATCTEQIPATAGRCVSTGPVSAYIGEKVHLSALALEKPAMAAVAALIVAYRYFTHQREVKKFHRWWESIAAPLRGQTLANEDPMILMARWRQVFQEAGNHWGVTLLNDTWLPVVYGLTEYLFKRWHLMEGKASPAPTERLMEDKASSAPMERLMEGKASPASMERLMEDKASSAPIMESDALSSPREEDHSLFSDLLCGSEEMISEEIVLSVIDLAEQVRHDRELASALENRKPEDLWRAVEEGELETSFCQAVRAYLHRYGDRCLHELKMEQPNLRHTPWVLLKMISEYARSDITPGRIRADISQDAIRSSISPEKISSDISQDMIHSSISPEKISSDISQDAIRSSISPEKISADISQDAIRSSISPERISADISQDAIRSSISPERISNRGITARHGDRCSASNGDRCSASNKGCCSVCAYRCSVSGGTRPVSDAYKNAQARLAKALRGHPLRLLIIHKLLNTLRRLIRNRENSRYCRSELFGFSKNVFRAISQHLADLKVLASPDDIVHLTHDEIFGYLDGTGISTNLLSLADIRRREFEENKKKVAPEQITTLGPVNENALSINQNALTMPGLRIDSGSAIGADEALPSMSCSIGAAGSVFGVDEALPSTGRASPSILRGIGSSAGKVCGRARIILDPNHAEALDKDVILVTRETDPGWIFLMLAARGIIIERGSMLSHTAITGRKFGIPTIVALPQATMRIPDGARLEMDGASGVVTILGH